MESVAGNQQSDSLTSFESLSIIVLLIIIVLMVVVVIIIAVFLLLLFRSRSTEHNYENLYACIKITVIRVLYELSKFLQVKL